MSSGSLLLSLLMALANVVPDIGARGARPAESRMRDIVIYASDVSQAALDGGWTLVSDDASPDGLKLAAGEDAVTDLATPGGSFEVAFTARPGVPYRLWLRLAAGDDSASHDSVWVQFSDAVLGGTPAYRIGTNDALLVKLEACDGCGDSGWGWQDSSWAQGQPSVVAFEGRGPHRIRVHVGQQGVQIDQIVLSPDRYLRAAPGAPRGDRTTISRTDGT